MGNHYIIEDMLGDKIKGVKRRPPGPCLYRACLRMPLFTPQDTKKSIVICPFRAHTRIFWYQLNLTMEVL